MRWVWLLRPRSAERSFIQAAAFGTKGGKEPFAAIANLIGHTREADLQRGATRLSFLRCGGLVRAQRDWPVFDRMKRPGDGINHSQRDSTNLLFDVNI